MEERKASGGRRGNPPVESLQQTLRDKSWRWRQALAAFAFLPVIVKWIDANPMVLPLRCIADSVLAPFARHAARSDRRA